jgi:hypothetical protein
MNHRATVTDLVLNFGDACRALLPSLDRARVPWADANQYDNWDRIAEALFESLVAEPCMSQANDIGLGALQLTKYGFDIAPSANAFIRVVAPLADDYRFIDLVSHDEPFGHVRALGKFGEIIAPLAQCEFSFVVTDPTGKQHRLTEISLRL